MVDDTCRAPNNNLYGGKDRRGRGEGLLSPPCMKALNVPLHMFVVVLTFLASLAACCVNIFFRFTVQEGCT